MTRLVIALLAALAVLGACGAEPAPSATGPQLIALRTAAQPPQACMDALASGRLVPMAVTGLGLLAADGTVMAVEWPFGYTATVIDSDVVLLDETGQPVARTGDSVQVGGGFGAQLWHACPPVEVINPG